MTDSITINTAANLMLNAERRKELRQRVAKAIEDTNTSGDPIKNAPVMAVNVLVEITGIDARYWMEDI